MDEDGDGFLTAEGDCEDTDATVNPGEVEACDGIDNNCDGVVDEGVATNIYLDEDGDGFGDDATVKGACEPHEGYITRGGDCDDADGWAECEDCDDLDPLISPEGAELCNGLDDDCDGAGVPEEMCGVMAADPGGCDCSTDGSGAGVVAALTALSLVSARRRIGPS